MTVERPRVAVVYPINFGDEDGIIGGGERYALELARSLAARTPTRLVTFGRRKRRYRDGPLEVHVYPWWFLARGIRTNPVTPLYLQSLLDVDVIHCMSWNTLATDGAVLMGRLLGKRVVVTDVGGGGGMTLATKLPIGKMVHRFLLIAAQGGAQFSQYRHKWGIIYAGVDTEKYRPGTGLKRRRVVFVGRLLPHKGVNYLIEAVDPKTELVVVGRPYSAEFHALLRRLSEGKRVTFVTDATDEQVVEIYQTSTVGVLPSVERDVFGGYSHLPELLGFAAMEAMSCGTAAICTDVGALAELVVDGETGYIVPPNDPATLGDRIRRLLADPELAARMGEAARQRIIQLFTWDAVAERCLRFYAP